MVRRNELYLLILSILLGISVLKLTEVFQFASQIKNTLNTINASGLSATHVGILLFIAGYLIFFLYVSLAGLNIVQQLINSPDSESLPDAGPLVAGSIIALTLTYLIVFAVAMYSIVGQ